MCKLKRVGKGLWYVWNSDYGMEGNHTALFTKPNCVSYTATYDSSQVMPFKWRLTELLTMWQYKLFLCWHEGRSTSSTWLTRSLPPSFLRSALLKPKARLSSFTRTQSSSKTENCWTSCWGLIAPLKILVYGKKRIAKIHLFIVVVSFKSTSHR